MHKKSRGLMSVLARAFPPPASLDLRAAGIDISDASVRWVVLDGERGSARVRSHGEEKLPEGVVVQGAIRDIPALTDVLHKIKAKLGNISNAHAALPEEAAYVFTMHVPADEGRDQILRMIEFELGDRVPIPPTEAVYDFDIVTAYDGDEGAEIAVAVFPRSAAEAYVTAFEGAGITLLSLEVEAYSIARAIHMDDDPPVTLLADFGRTRTGFALLKRGVPIFTSTVEIGGESAAPILAKALALSPEELEKFKDEEGLRAKADSPGLNALVGTASAFADEVARHYHYWDTHRDSHGERSTPVDQVVIVGGASNMNGIADYVARRVHATTTRGDIWRNVCSFESYIPPIDYRTSLQYATAVGLALRAI